MEKQPFDLYRIGAHRHENGTIKFCVWAPKAESLPVIILNKEQEFQYPMQSLEKGFYEVSIPNVPQSIDYVFCINNNKRRPDPASHWQPKGVHGPSRIVDVQEFKWTDFHWKGIPLGDYLIYELHIGTFTSEGTFTAVIDKLPHLKKLGITAIELMPIMEFPGDRNWGYDLAYPYAPHHSYGGPNGLKTLVNSCHDQGFAVILDVVYNHLGPEGNYLGDFGYYFTDRYKSPWGQAINYDGHYSDFVRQYFIENALYYLTDFHIDALRLDAVHAIFDFSAYPFLEELRDRFHKQADNLGRLAYVFAESDLNDVRLIKPNEQGGYNIDAQWSDDFHHALYALQTKSQWDYFLDYGSYSDLAKAITKGFVYEGQWSEFRMRSFGSSSNDRPGSQFIICIQNHDQIGNAGQGKRLNAFISEEEYRIASMLLLCSPNIPLLFMGQEWNAKTPFLFFTNYEDRVLAKNVKEGYQREFHLDNCEAFDPQNAKRFEQSKLQWKDLEENSQANMLAYYQELIHLRKEVKCLSNNNKELTSVICNDPDEWMIIERNDPSSSAALIVVNFSKTQRLVKVNFGAGQWTLRLLSNRYSKDKYPNIINTTIPTSQSLLMDPQTAAIYIRAHIDTARTG
jgi:maltooligosyltrehalose trehalohydrolase